MRVSSLFTLAKDQLEDLRAPTDKPKVHALPDHYEVESKIPLQGDKQIEETMHRLQRKTDLLFAGTRERTDIIYADSAAQYDTLTLSAKRNGTTHGIRSKERGQLILSPQDVPMLARREFKYDCDDPGFNDVLRNVLRKERIGEFEKRCVDVMVQVRGMIFVVTFSLVNLPAPQEDVSLAQLEMEMKGAVEKRAFKRDRVLDAFDRAAEIVFNGRDASTLTKLEWIARQTGHEEVIPQYSAVSPQKSRALSDLVA